MNTWILILAIASNNSQQSPSYTSVPGFLDSGSCTTAGNAAISAMEKATPIMGGAQNRARFVCVATKSI